ncbi:MAG: biopolymer transporter ExbD [Verrucomicrobiales bacterium]|nr:biopolymer transporter ExbD [Verrucomicrobiales bacterium]
MIDVLLVLLIFFMSITSAQVLEIDKDIHLPVAADAKKKDNKNAMNEAALNVRWMPNEQRALFKLNSNELPEEEIVSRLSTLKETNPTYRVIIRADKDTPAVQVQKAMTIIGQAGIDDISFSALNQE